MNLFQKIKALFAIKSSVDKIIKEAKTMDGSKTGWKTTEFWMNVAAQVGVIWGSVQGFVPPKWAGIISIAGAAVYTIARTVSKAVSDIQTAKTATDK